MVVDVAVAADVGVDVDVVEGAAEAGVVVVAVDVVEAGAVAEGGDVDVVGPRIRI